MGDEKKSMGGLCPPVFYTYLGKTGRHRIKLFEGKIPANWVDRETWDEILLCGKVVGRMASVGNVQGIRGDRLDECG